MNRVMGPYELSISIVFPPEISEIIRKEKERLVTEYGSKYESQPHITLYLDSYTEDGFSKLLHDLGELQPQLKTFTITLLPAEARFEPDRHRNLYVIEIGNKEKVTELHNILKPIADRYQSPLLREKSRKLLEKRGIVTDGRRDSIPVEAIRPDNFDPHITLGAVDLDAPQPSIDIIRAAVHSLEGTAVNVGYFEVKLFGKKPEGAEKNKPIEKAAIPLS